MCLPKKLVQAYKVLQRTVMYNPDHLEALLRFANFCRILIRKSKDEEEYQDVAELYAKAEQLCQGDLERELELANHYFFIEKLPEALAAAQRAQEAAPEDSRVYHLLGCIYLQMDEFDLAKEALERALLAVSSEVQLYHDLATLYIKQEQLAEAVKALESALASCSQTSEQGIRMLQICILQMKSENFGLALMACQEALSLSPDDVNLIYTLIGIHQQMMDYEAALQLLESKLLKIVGGLDQRALHLQATIYLQDQQAEKAIEIYGKLVKIDDQNANWYYHLAHAYQQAGQKEQANKAVRRALRYNRQHQESKALFNQINQKKKQDEDDGADQDKPENQTENQIENSKKRVYFDPLYLDEFLEELALEPVIAKLCQYLEQRYWKNRDRRGQKPKVAYRSLILMQLVMGIKDWNFNELYDKFRSKKKGGKSLRGLLGLPVDANEIAHYTTYKRKLNKLGRYPIKFIMNHLVRQAATPKYIDLSNVLLDSSNSCL